MSGDALHPLADRAVAARNTARDVPSPCISVCRMEAATGWCEGCLRTLDEIAAWGRMDPAGKRAIWAQIEERLAVRTGESA